MAIAASVFGAIGVASAVGGFVGFRRAGSVASLVAGGASAAALFGACALLGVGLNYAGLGLGAVTCAALATRFVPAYLKTRRLVPQGLMATLASAGVLTALLGALWN